MNHVLHSCDQPGCFVCDGGLGLCDVCGGAESAIPTECPGTRMTTAQSDAVAAGTLDFRAGLWVDSSLEGLTALRERYGRLPVGCGAMGRKAAKQAWYMRAYKMGWNREQTTKITALTKLALEIVIAEEKGLHMSESRANV